MDLQTFLTTVPKRKRTLMKKKLVHLGGGDPWDLFLGFVDGCDITYYQELENGSSSTTSVNQAACFDYPKAMNRATGNEDRRNHQMKRAKKRRIADDNNEESERLMAKFRDMSATNDHPLRVLSKVVEKSDTKKEQNRLLLSKQNVHASRLLEPLTEEERILAGKEEENKDSEGLDVVMVDEEGREYKVVLRFLTSNNAYRIRGKDYAGFIKDNNLTPKLDTVHLCFFRARDEQEGQLLHLRLGVIKTTTCTVAEEQAVLHTAVYEEDEVLRRRAIREGKKPLLEEEEEVLRCRAIREGKSPLLEEEEEVLRHGRQEAHIRGGEGGSEKPSHQQLLKLDLNLLPSEDWIS